MGKYQVELLIDAFGGSYDDWDRLEEICANLEKAGYEVYFTMTKEKGCFKDILYSLYNKTIEQFFNSLQFYLEEDYDVIDAEFIWKFSEDVKDDVYFSVCKGKQLPSVFSNYIEKYDVESFIKDFITRSEDGELTIKRL